MRQTQPEPNHNIQTNTMKAIQQPVYAPSIRNCSRPNLRGGFRQILLLTAISVALGWSPITHAEQIQIECERMTGDGHNMQRSGASGGLTRRLTKPGHRLVGEFTSPAGTFYLGIGLSHRGRPVSARITIDHGTNTIFLSTVASRHAALEVARSWNDILLNRSFVPCPLRAGRHTIEIELVECEEAVEYDFIRLDSEPPHWPELPILVEAEAAGQGQTMMRSQASGGATRLLQSRDDVAIIPFGIAGAPAAELVLRYSNDSGPDEVEIILDHDPKKVWRFTSETTRVGALGSGWNEFRTRRFEIGKLAPGPHALIIRLIRSDWGIEIDSAEFTKSTGKAL